MKGALAFFCSYSNYLLFVSMICLGGSSPYLTIAGHLPPVLPQTASSPLPSLPLSPSLPLPSLHLSAISLPSLPLPPPPEASQEGGEAALLPPAGPKGRQALTLTV